MNGTFREIERRILDYRERTGGDYAKVWITRERWMLLPQAFRDAVGPNPSRLDGLGTIAGVPLGLIQVLDPDPTQRPQARWSASYRAADGVRP